MAGLASEGTETKTIMIDVHLYLKAHRTASSLRVKKGGPGRLIGSNEGGMNTKLHAVTDAIGTARSPSQCRRVRFPSDYSRSAAFAEGVCQRLTRA